MYNVYEYEQKVYDSTIRHVCLLGKHVYGVKDRAWHDSAGNAAVAPVSGGGAGAGAAGESPGHRPLAHRIVARRDFARKAGSAAARLMCSPVSSCGSILL